MRIKSAVLVSICAGLLVLLPCFAVAWDWQPPMTATVTGPSPNPTAGDIFQYGATSLDNDTNNQQQLERECAWGYPSSVNSGPTWVWIMTGSDGTGEHWQMTVWSTGPADVDLGATDTFSFVDVHIGRPIPLYRDDPDIWGGTTIVVEADCGWIRGNVRDAQTHEPIQGATFEVDDGWYPGSSDANGYYELRLLVPGSRKIKCLATGHAPAEGNVNVAAGEATVRNWELTPN